MKRVLKVFCGFVAVLGLILALQMTSEARTFVSVGIGFPIYAPYCGPAYYSYPSPPCYYYRPAYRCYYRTPVYYYSGGVFYYR